MTIHRPRLTALVMAAVLLEGCVARNASLTTRYTTAEPVAARDGVRLALEECGYASHGEHGGEVSGLRLESVPDEQSAGTTAAKAACISEGCVNNRLKPMMPP